MNDFTQFVFLLWMILSATALVAIAGHLDDTNQMLWDIDYMIAEQTGYTSGYVDPTLCLYVDGSLGECYPDVIWQ